MEKQKNCLNQGDCLCSLKNILDVVSKKWTICIVSILDQEEPMRFSEIKHIIQTISPKSLSDTLKILEKEKIISKKMFSEIPPRVEYCLTDKGKSLKKALKPLVEWAVTQNTIQ